MELPVANPKDQNSSSQRIFDSINYFHIYKQFLLHNPDAISKILDSILHFIQFLPGRFSRSEIFLETVYTLFNSVHLFNDTILSPQEPIPTITPLYQSRPKPHRYWNTPHFLISTIQVFEVLIEVAVEKLFSSKNHQNLLIGVESFKAVCRFFILYQRRGNMVVDATPPPDYIPKILSMLRKDPVSTTRSKRRTGRFQRISSSSSISSSDQSTLFDIPTTPKKSLKFILHTPLSNSICQDHQHPQSKINIDYTKNGFSFKFLLKIPLIGKLLFKVATTYVSPVLNFLIWAKDSPQQLKNMTIFNLVKIGTKLLFFLGETATILRSTLFVFLMAKNSKNSWIPWIVSLSCDIVGIISSVTAMILEDYYWVQYLKPDPETVREFAYSRHWQRDELLRRLESWKFYLLRPPFFDKILNIPFQIIQSIATHIPILNGLVQHLYSLLYGLQSRYFYISGS